MTNRTRQSELHYLTGLMLILVSDHATAQENASNPLAAVSNTDLSIQQFDSDGREHTGNLAELNTIAAE